jgi:hypothetical protein
MIHKQPVKNWSLSKSSKSFLGITAYKMKSVIIRDINKLVTYGIKELYNISERLFLKWLMKFNR